MTDWLWGGAGGGERAAAGFLAGVRKYTEMGDREYPEWAGSGTHPLYADGIIMYACQVQPEPLLHFWLSSMAI